MAKVFIPPLLRDLTGGESSVTVEGSSIRQIVAALDKRYPGIGNRLRQGDRLAAGLSAVVDGVASSRGLFTKVEPNSEVHFLPAISGG